MKKELIAVRSARLDLPGVLWLPEGEVIVVLQITHGMTEHMGRYETLARMLTDSGIAAAGFDLPGHGLSGSDPDCASFGEDGWEEALAAMHTLGSMLAQRFPAAPRFLLGFSLGSFLVREYLGHGADDLAGAAILGTGDQPSAVLSLMRMIVRTQIKKAGFDHTTPLVQSLSFGTYNKKFAPNRTAADWLCADTQQLDCYLADPLCRPAISAGLFYQLLGSMQRTGKAACKGWKKDLPILLLSGDKDPVGDMSKGVLHLRRAMNKAQLQCVTMHLLPGARHDVLHEEDSACAAKARDLLLAWMLVNIPG